MCLDDGGTPTQRTAALKDACGLYPEPNFGVALTGAQKAARSADCELFMGGILRNGEFVAMRYFLHLSRTLGIRLSGMLTQPSSVSATYCSWRVCLVHSRPCCVPKCRIPASYEVPSTP